MWSLIINLFISLGVGGLSSFLTRDSMDIYKYIILPPGAPPSWLFPIVWIILYILMAISADIIYKNSKGSFALGLYGLQLIFNFIWPLLFFNGRSFLAAFIWLMILWLLVIFMMIKFYKIKPIAAYLQIPYILWLTYAAYLNLSIYILNR